MKTFVTAKILNVFILMMAAAILLSCGSSRKSIVIEEGWDLLGESKVDFIDEKDKVEVLSEKKYTAIKFRVEKRGIRLKNLNVVYLSGDKLSPAMDDEIAADQFSREIELSPEGKIIRSVDFKYHTTGNILKGRGNVLLFGKRYVPPATMKTDSIK